MNQFKQLSLIRKIIAISLVVIAVLFAALLFVVFWQGSTKDIEAAAKGFSPPGDWVQTRYNVVPPKFICLVGGCPELVQSWTVDRVITEDEFKQFLGNLNTIEIKEDKCSQKVIDDFSGSCRTSGMRGEFRFSVYVELDENNPNKSKIDLFIRKGV